MNDIGLARNMDNDEKAFPKNLEEVNTKPLFGFSSNMKVYGFKEKTKFVSFQIARKKGFIQHLALEKILLIINIIVLNI